MIEKKITNKGDLTTSQSMPNFPYELQTGQQELVVPICCHCKVCLKKWLEKSHIHHIPSSLSISYLCEEGRGLSQRSNNITQHKTSIHSVRHRASCFTNPIATVNYGCVNDSVSIDSPSNWFLESTCKSRSNFYSTFPLLSTPSQINMNVNNSSRIKYLPKPSLTNFSNISSSWENICHSLESNLPSPVSQVKNCCVSLRCSQSTGNCSPVPVNSVEQSIFTSSIPDPTTSEATASLDDSNSSNDGFLMSSFPSDCSVCVSPYQSTTILSTATELSETHSINAVVLQPCHVMPFDSVSSTKINDTACFTSVTSNCSSIEDLSTVSDLVSQHQDKEAARVNKFDPSMFEFDISIKCNALPCGDGNAVDDIPKKYKLSSIHKITCRTPVAACLSKQSKKNPTKSRPLFQPSSASLILRSNNCVTRRFLITDTMCLGALITGVGVGVKPKDRRLVGTLLHYPGARAELVECAITAGNNISQKRDFFLYLRTETWNQMRWIVRDIDRFYPTWCLSRQLTR